MLSSQRMTPPEDLPDEFALTPPLTEEERLEPEILSDDPFAITSSSSDDSVLDFKEATPPPIGAGALEKIKDFSEKVGIPQSVSAALPFSLMIDGPLNDYEKEKLLDLLSRENMGIREVDLEPQFVSQRILIPRISEFAAILLVQALRGAQAKLRLGPSDSIFTTEGTREPETQEEHFNTSSIRGSTTPGNNRAEQVRISADPTIADLPDVRLIDLIVASAILEADTVEAHHSPEYQEVMDALILELKYKAFRKGAVAIVNFTFELISLSLPSQYRMTASGYAVGYSIEPGL